MKSFREELILTIPTRRAFVNITPQVEAALARSGIREGLVLVNPMHLRPACLSRRRARLHQDFERWLERWLRKALGPIPPQRGEDNADAHLSAPSWAEAVIAVTAGKLVSDRGSRSLWEFDGSAARRRNEC
jgi:thiamine phosphate synthase YjbQ (UPF0047 family)